MYQSTDFDAVRKPLLEASTLSSDCYISDRFFELEKKHIFSSAWHFVGRTDEISEVGDFLAVDTPAGCALVSRCSNNEIKAFINACRHRGTRLKEKNGRCKLFICPYHAWSYGLDGALKSAPGMDASNFNKDSYGLSALRLEIWSGFIFINFDRDAADLLTWLDDMPVTMQSHSPDSLICTKRLEFKVKANWKLVIENALEAYHTGTVHQSSLGAQRSESIHATGQWDALFVLNESDKSIATLPGELQALPFIPTLSEKSKQGTWFTVIYPCTQLVFSQDCVWWLDIKPVSTSETQLIVGGCFPRETIALDQFAENSVAYYHRWRTATAEDNAIVEKQQQGHMSGHQPSGRFSSREHCVHKLNNWVLDKVFGESVR
ncbi:MAG: aromatic ring-hydroxylating dioxygenase subunit alpha [Acidiferrobacterales bacterium]|nr:aromatic ring-hydroxylating dioxygenase subunit alpha [Acidiferrobacterales bacterium]